MLMWESSAFCVSVLVCVCISVRGWVYLRVCVCVIVWDNVCVAEWMWKSARSWVCEMCEGMLVCVHGWVRVGVCDHVRERNNSWSFSFFLFLHRMPVQYCLASAAATTTTAAAAAATKLLLEMQFSVLTRQQVGGRWLQIAQNKIVSFCHKMCLRKLEITCLEKDSNPEVTVWSWF